MCKLLRKQPRTQDCFTAWQEIYQNKLSRREWLSDSVKGIVLVHLNEFLSSQINKETHDAYLTVLLASCLDGAKLLIRL